MIKILISACLYGHNVRYDGKNSSILHNPLFKKLQQLATFYPFCPEEQGGLSTPRIPSEIIALDPLQLKNKNGEDTTQFFNSGAEKTLQFCKEQKITIALMKSNSPSCSNEYIYDGTFSKKKLKHEGVTVSLLKKNNFFIFNEHQLPDLLDFIENTYKI